MLPYMIRRSSLIIPTIWAVISIVFVVVHLVPGNPAQVLLGPFATAAREAAMNKAWGLDNPLYIQYLDYLRNIVSGNLGVSLLSGKSAAVELATVFPDSLLLGLSAIILATIIGIPLGVFAAMFQDSWIDRVALVASLLLISTPDFFLGIVLLLVFSGTLGWLPSIGVGTMGDPISVLSHLILPAIALSAGLLAYVTRMTRTSMIGVLREDFVRTAQSKGVSRRAIIWKHSLRNALIPVLSIVGVGAGQVLGGTVVIETVFARPGVGTLLVNAITGRDYVMVQACVILIATVFVLINLAVDLFYAMLDPRIEYV